MKFDRIRVSAALAALACMVPQAAYAEESGSGAEILIPKPAEFIPALVIFLIILAVLGKLVWPSVLAMFEQREKTIADSLKEADETRAHSAEVRAQADSVIADARRQASDIVLSARSDAEKERARIVAEAHSEAEDIISKARDRAEDEMQRAHANATDTIAKTSVAIAGKIVGDVLADDPAKQRELIEKYIAEVGSLHA